MAQLPPDGQYLIQQIDGQVILYHRDTEEELLRFDPSDANAASKAQLVIHELEQLNPEQKCFAHFWSGYFYAHTSGSGEGAHSMSDIETTFSERGFAQYGEPVATSYGHSVRVYESSAASGPHIWLNITREASARGQHEEAVAHLTLAQAIAIRDRLVVAIDQAKQTWEPSAWGIA